MLAERFTAFASAAQFGLAFGSDQPNNRG